MSQMVLVSSVIGGIGVTAGIGYLFLMRHAPEIPTRLESVGISPRTWSHRIRRRRIGAALMVIIGAMFFIGVNHLDAPRPHYYLAFWALLIAMLAWLVCLAVIDLVQLQMWIRRIHRESQRRLEDILAGARSSTARKDRS